MQQIERSTFTMLLLKVDNFEKFTVGLKEFSSVDWVRTLRPVRQNMPLRTRSSHLS